MDIRKIYTSKITKDICKSAMIVIVFISVILEMSGQTTQVFSLASNGINRSFRIHFPSNISDTKDRPVVINMHGYGSNALEQEIYTQMDPVADKEGFIVIYPDGINAAWNVGWSFGSTADDVLFTSDLIDYMVNNYSVDKQRIYACGLSNGGFMSYYLACNLPNKIAAIASVAGSMVPANVGLCSTNVPMPVMQIHGTNDQVVPYTGLSPISAPIESVVKFWVDHNGCQKTPTITPFTDINTNDNTTSERYVYASGKNGSEVQFIKVTGGAHTWPGAIIDIDVTSKDFKASEEIWAFFKRFSLQINSAVSDVSVLPVLGSNPVHEMLFLTTAVPVEGSIYNLSGQRLIDFYSAVGENSIDVTKLSAGQYFVKFKNSNVPVKFVKW